ncbi:solute carrier family 15 member 1-like [Photinus pyralis]|uniref:solute carrier family 15 member 1-like n=1 Tax=Photinus pyralis TaxID=7054 RepID=UPI00126732C2|nr:solute carrier family 15 member 1-like [Photinus pyralis]
MAEKYPTSVFCIIATEFCERFSFCGLRTILSLYLRNQLLLSENTATIIYHVFIMICYVVPIAGAVCADSFLGRYRTILYFSLIYLAGNVLMCLASVPSSNTSRMLLTSFGLGLIAIGTGGIKPCVAAFGGDQFHLPQQQELLQHFFSIFYFSINLGGFVGMILTPILRKSVTCFGEDTCYPLGFGFPALLMLLALLMFMLGKPFYRLKTPKENVMLKFIQCTLYAVSQKVKNKTVKYEHWLDYAKDKFPDNKLISDMKTVFAVLLLFAPLPIFWSLFDQQGSRWTFQASRMDGSALGSQILPDQMQVINPAIVLVLIPIFDRLLYPLLNRIHVLECPLHRMAVGGIIAGAAFLSAGILELVLETTYPDIPAKNRASFNFINTLPCDILINSPVNGMQALCASMLYHLKNLPARNNTTYNIMVEAPTSCGNLELENEKFNFELVAAALQIDTILVTVNSHNEVVAYVTEPIDFKRSLNGKPKIRIVYIGNAEVFHNITISLANAEGLNDVYFVDYKPQKHMAVSAYLELPPGEYTYLVKCRENENLYGNVTRLELGGIYTLVIRQHLDKIDFAKVYTMSPPNSIPMTWLIPQYFLISIAEIMFGIAGLEFSFTQAPKCLKTVTIAGWYLSVAVGNFFVIVITQANFFRSQAYEFFLFAILIVVDMIVFTEMAVTYKITVPEPDSSEFILLNEEAIPLLEPASMLANTCSLYS